MDVQQIRKLRPKLRKFLKRFDHCFPRKDTRAPVNGDSSSSPSGTSWSSSPTRCDAWIVLGAASPSRWCPGATARID